MERVKAVKGRTETGVLDAKVRITQDWQQIFVNGFLEVGDRMKDVQAMQGMTQGVKYPSRYGCDRVQSLDVSDLINA